VTFEGQAAIALEAVAESRIDDRYGFEIENGEPAVLDFRPAITEIVKDLSRGRRIGEISACFHNTLSCAIGEVCGRIDANDGLNRICLSGGSFQNLYLLGLTVVELRRRGFEIFLHAQVPANDGGLSLGQAVIANQCLREGD
jgi:hydrogenase maturation protein HypF